MSSRLLTAVFVLQSLLLTVLVAERLIPVAHAAAPVACEITNWPDALASNGFASIRVKLEPVTTALPVVVRDWETSDQVNVVVQDWNTSDEVKVNVTNEARVNVTSWDTSDEVKTRQ